MLKVQCKLLNLFLPKVPVGLQHSTSNVNVTMYSIMKNSCTNKLDFLFGLTNVLRQEQYKKQL